MASVHGLTEKRPIGSNVIGGKQKCLRQRDMNVQVLSAGLVRS